jgi:hypothetical protein
MQDKETELNRLIDPVYIGFSLSINRAETDLVRAHPVSDLAVRDWISQSSHDKLRPLLYKENNNE